MWGFSVDYNRYLSRHQLGGRKLPEALFLITTIAYVLTCVFAPFSLATPDANWVFSVLVIVNAVLLCTAVAKACDAVNALGTPSLTTTPGKILDLDATRNFSIYCVLWQYEDQQLSVG